VKKVLLVAFVFALAGASPVAATRSSGMAYSMPSWSPDGKHIAFIGSGPGDLFVMNADGSQLRQLTHASVGSAEYSARFPTWSPDGRKIAFGYGYSGVFVINVDGSGLHRITQTGDAPAWSPRGKRIAFVDSPTELSGGRIYVMRPDGTGKQLVAAPTGWRSFGTTGGVAWSPDGQSLAFLVSTAPDEDVHAGYLGVIGQYQGRVRVFLRGKNVLPSSWHGTKIAVGYGVRPHRTGLCDLRTGTLKYLHDGQHPSWSPNGRRLVFSYHGAIWGIKPDGTSARKLTH